MTDTTRLFESSSKVASMETAKACHIKTGAANERVRLAEIHGRDPGVLDSTLWDIFSNTASRYPHREAIVSMWQQSWSWESSPSSSSTKRDNLRWTYLDLINKSQRVATSLENLGCRRGMRLGAILWNSFEWGLFFWAAAKLGMVFAPIDPRDPDEARNALGCLKPDIVVVQDADGVTFVDGKEPCRSASSIYIQCSGTPLAGWVCLDHVISERYRVTPFPMNRPRDGSSTREVTDKDVALIIFTSGTTGRPKGCPHTNANLMSQTSDYDPNLDGAFVDRWLIHTPVSHIFAVNNALRAWRYGGAAVFPSRTFDIESTVRALVEERCTVMSATPTLVKALLAHPECPSSRDMSLSVVTIAATKISPEDIRLCREELGARDAIQAYGLSEGAPLISWSRRDELLKERPNLGVGIVLPGASVRVCHPTTHRVLNFHEIGELHVSGPSIISGYLDQTEPGAFYDNGAGRWFATGDQAMIAGNGVVHILGRYKDLIIRGGENINPMRIEEALMGIKGVQVSWLVHISGRILTIQSWVVGVLDSLAGEVPVAVVQLPEGISKDQLYEKATSLGSNYALAGIYTLDELQLESLPKTSIGKVKKGKLRDTVRKVRSQRAIPRGLIQSREFISMNTAPDNFVTRLVDIWQELTGSRPSPSTRMAHIADSITLLRYCDAIFRSCGKRLYLQDVVEHDTIERHACLLATRDSSERSHLGASPTISMRQTIACHSPSPPPVYTGPVATNGLNTIRPCKPGKQEYRPWSREERLRAQALAEMDNAGLGSLVVEDIVPIRESLHRMAIGQRPQSYHLRMVFRVHNANIQKIRCGIEKALACRSMLRTFLFESDLGELYHATLGAGHELWEKMISTRELEFEEEAKRHWQDDSEVTHSSPLMFNMEIISVRESGSRYLSMLFNHSVVDALSLWPWHKDLDLLIDNINAETWKPTPFKLFADLFSQYRNSTPAQEAVSFHVKRLRGISRLRQALWPLQRAPGWMISSDRGSKCAYARDEVRNVVWNGERKANASAFRYPRLGRVVCLPQLRKLTERGIEPSLFAKSAIVIFNVLKTSASHAVFNTWESGRSWPFVPRWMEGMLPPAMSIDGPTVEWVLNMIEVVKDESILDFFQRTAAESEEVRHYEHVPWQKVVKELRDEGDVAIDASFRQSFVWDVSLGLSALKGNRTPFKCLEPVARLDWADW